MEIQLNEYMSISKIQDIKNKLTNLRKVIEDNKSDIIDDIRAAKKNNVKLEDNSWTDTIGLKISYINENIITTGIENIEKSLEDGNYTLLISKIDECLKSLDNTIKEKSELEELKNTEEKEYNLDYIRQLPIKENSFRDSVIKTNRLLNQLKEIKFEQ